MNIKFARPFAKLSAPNYIPQEDKFFATSNIAVVADGITRDSIGCPDMDAVSQDEIFTNYPNPSPAALAAEITCRTFRENHNSYNLRELMEMANANIHVVNANVECDFCENDYAGCVAATVKVENMRLHYAYICDCGVVVWDKDGNIKFVTIDEMEDVGKNWNNSFEGEYSWSLPSGRRYVREYFRNNLNNPYSYGALTGERSAEHYIRSGEIQLEETDTIAVFSDGFRPYIMREDFFMNLRSLESLEAYVNAMQDLPNLGSEKTIIVVNP